MADPFKNLDEPWLMEVEDPRMQAMIRSNLMLRARLRTGQLRPQEMMPGHDFGHATGGWGATASWFLKNPLIATGLADMDEQAIRDLPGDAPGLAFQGVQRWANRDWWDRFTSTQPFFQGTEDKDTYFAVGIMKAIQECEQVTDEEKLRAMEVLRWNWRGKTSGHELTDTLAKSYKMGTEAAIMSYTGFLPKFAQSAAVGRTLGGVKGATGVMRKLWEGLRVLVGVLLQEKAGKRLFEFHNHHVHPSLGASFFGQDSYNHQPIHLVENYKDPFQFLKFLYSLNRNQSLSHPVWFNIQPHCSKSPVVIDRSVSNCYACKSSSCSSIKLS